MNTEKQTETAPERIWIDPTNPKLHWVGYCFDNAVEYVLATRERPAACAGQFYVNSNECIECGLSRKAHTTTAQTRAHVEGCTKALSVPVDLCECGGRVIVWPTTAAEAAAREIANALLTTGSGRKGDHLQIVEGTPPNSVYLAGWCEQAIVDQVAAIISKHTAGDVEDKKLDNEENSV